MAEENQGIGSRPGRSRTSVRLSLDEYGRGVAGGLLFSLPLLYTQEVWDLGASVSPLRLLIGLLFTFLLLLGYNYYAGLRQDAGWVEVLIDSIEELGLGLLVSAMILWLLGRFETGPALGEVVGQIILEAMVVAVGVSVGTAQLGQTGDGNGSGGDSKASEGGRSPQPRQPQRRSTLDDHPGSQIVLGICGAFLIVANIAPTEEIVKIGNQASMGKLLGLALLSLAVGAVILFFSNFRGSRRKGSSQDPGMILRWTVVTYGLALVTATFVLWFFGRFENTALAAGLAYTVTAGFPAVLGASAGRLLLQV